MQRQLIMYNTLGIIASMCAGMHRRCLPELYPTPDAWTDSAGNCLSIKKCFFIYILQRVQSHLLFLTTVLNWQIELSAPVA
jgi:hypothetical protein